MLGDVLKLSLGTLGGRMIFLLSLPIISRLYSPEDFALLAIYLALVSSLAVTACLRLEIAIPLAESDEEAASLLVLSLCVLALVVAVVAVLTGLLRAPLVAVLGAPALATWLWLVPLGVAMAGSYTAMQFWATRAHRFGDIARTRVTQAVSGVAAMLTLGWFGYAPFGLLLGNMLNMGAGGIGLAASAMARDGRVLRGVRLGSLVPTLQRNRRFPIFSAPEALFNIAGLQIPVLMIAAHAGPEAGFLLLAMQVMLAPMALLGSSISQVYISRAPTERRDGRLRPFTLAIMRRLALIGVPPLVLVGAFAPLLFPLIFGPVWLRAGEIVTLLAPWMALQFIASPVSMVMHVVGQQRAMLALTISGAVLRILAVGGAVYWDASLVLAFALSSALFYAICCVVFIRASRADMQRN